jgi:hypothetical protein
MEQMMDTMDRMDADGMFMCHEDVHHEKGP